MVFTGKFSRPGNGDGFCHKGLKGHQERRNDVTATPTARTQRPTKDTKVSVCVSRRCRRQLPIATLLQIPIPKSMSVSPLSGRRYVGLFPTKSGLSRSGTATGRCLLNTHAVLCVRVVALPKLCVLCDKRRGRHWRAVKNRCIANRFLSVALCGQIGRMFGWKLKPVQFSHFTQSGITSLGRGVWFRPEGPSRY